MRSGVAGCCLIVNITGYGVNQQNMKAWVISQLTAVWFVILGFQLILSTSWKLGQWEYWSTKVWIQNGEYKMLLKHFAHSRLKYAWGQSLTKRPMMYSKYHSKFHVWEDDESSRSLCHLCKIVHSGFWPSILK